MMPRLRSARFETGLIVGCVVLLAAACTAGPPVAIRADQIVDNLDSTRTFVRPRIQGEAGHLRIGQGIPGACRLFGMEGYLKEYVKWSLDLGEAVPVSEDGQVGEARLGRYIEAITCTPKRSHVPRITVESKSEASDGSVTVTGPRVHHGPEHFPILSGHAGACQLLGYAQKVEYSLEWSSGPAHGVSLTLSGRIYERASGTYLTALGCKQKP
ncbi:MAG: hypothetical protein GY910_26285 [bacterium]|nr:hypothetical protein [Deltaproteobacteria bacterium]MCP4908498.1 hypothetical protein [bacterium]